MDCDLLFSSLSLSLSLSLYSIFRKIGRQNEETLLDFVHKENPNEDWLYCKPGLNNLILYHLQSAS